MAGQSAGRSFEADAAASTAVDRGSCCPRKRGRVVRAPTEQIISISRLICTGCGAETSATCDCGMEDRPKLVRAREAVAAEPERSDRAIAKKLGLHHSTVNEARKRLSDNPTVNERIGLDGKTRKLPRRIELHVSDPLKAECEDCDTPTDCWQRSLANNAGDAAALRAFWSREYPGWEQFRATSDLIALAKEAAAAWSEIVELLKRSHDLSIPEFLRRGS